MEKYFVLLLHCDPVSGERGQGQQLAPKSQSNPHSQFQPIFLASNSSSLKNRLHWAAEQNRKRDVAMLSVYSNRSCPHLPCIFGLPHSPTPPPPPPPPPPRCSLPPPFLSSAVRLRPSSPSLPNRPYHWLLILSINISCWENRLLILRQSVVFVPSLTSPSLCSSLLAAKPAPVWLNIETAVLQVSTKYQQRINKISSQSNEQSRPPSPSSSAVITESKHLKGLLGPPVSNEKWSLSHAISWRSLGTPH